MRSITIIGGGLAGLSLGIALRQRNVPVVVHEAGAYPRHRVCGEFINGLEPETIDQLGIGSVFRSAVSNQSTAWYSGSRLLMRADLPRSVMGLSRWQLDHELAREFQRLGGELHVNSRHSDAGGYDRAEGVVFCKGRRPAKESPWIGLKAHVSGLETSADLEMHLGAGGYVGLARIEEDQTNVCGLFRRTGDVSGARERLLCEYLKRCRLGSLAGRMESATAVSGSFLGVSSMVFGQPPGSKDASVIALGDQRSMICPFTGNGMASAFQSAAIAVGSLAAYASGHAGWGSTVTEVNEALAKRQDRRISLSTAIQPFLIGGWRRKVVEFLAATRLLPFGVLSRRLQ